MRRMKKKDEIGAIGIGTLIVFIALILVAAIAAAVIIGTAEDLEERSEQAGQDAEALLSGKIIIWLAEGSLDASGDIDSVDLYLDLYGSSGIDMRDIILHVVATSSSGSAVSQDLTYNVNNPTQATALMYSTTEVSDPLNTYDPTSGEYVLGERTSLFITIDLGLSTTALSEASTLQIYTKVTTSGTVTKDLWRTPSAYPPSGVVLLDE